MIVSGYGSTWAGAYQFPSSAMADEWSHERAVISQRVNGLPGEFDHSGDDAFPVQAITVTKRFTITSTTWAGVETELELLRTALASAVETKLWATQRDGSHRWAWAKVDRLSAPDRVGQILHCPVEIVFSLREGLWYGETINSEVLTSTGAHVLTNDGDTRAIVKVTVIPAGYVMLGFGVTATGQGWAWVGSLAATKSLIIDAAAYAATNDGADVFDQVTPVDAFDFWLYLEPGDNTLTITKNQNVLGTFSATFEYWDTYL